MTQDNETIKATGLNAGFTRACIAGGIIGATVIIGSTFQKKFMITPVTETDRLVINFLVPLIGFYLITHLTNNILVKYGAEKIYTYRNTDKRRKEGFTITKILGFYVGLISSILFLTLMYFLPLFLSEAFFKSTSEDIFVIQDMFFVAEVIFLVLLYRFLIR